MNKKYFIGDEYLLFLTDDFGVWQHSKGSSIDKKYGYALDDNARGLIYAIKVNNLKIQKIYLDYVIKSILEDVLFFDQDKVVSKFLSSEDAYGEAMWSLCEYYKIHKDHNIGKIISAYIEKSYDTRFIRGWSYLSLAYSGINKNISYIFNNRIIDSFNDIADIDWLWPEEQLSYANAIIPMALINSASKYNDKKLLEYGLLMLNFLNYHTIHNSLPIAIGNTNWFIKNTVKSLNDQQPIDISYQTLANIYAFKATGRNEYRKYADFYFSWFWGNNIIGKSVVDIETQRCMDGISLNNVSKNCGAESIICYLLAQKELCDNFV